MATAEITRVKVIHEGETVDAEEMDFDALIEDSQTYSVKDGTHIEIRHQVKKVYRLCDQKKPNGDPIYILTGTAEITTIPATPTGRNE
jgi:hypothetical protein